MTSMYITSSCDLKYDYSQISISIYCNICKIIKCFRNVEPLRIDRHPGEHYTTVIMNKCSDRSMEVKLSARQGNYDRPTDKTGHSCQRNCLTENVCLSENLQILGQG